jgi:hypothetical protein
MKCRHCQAEVTLPLVDLGCQPSSNAYLSADLLDAPETTHPLRAFVCEQCWLVQTEDFAAATDLFAQDYAYFSSTSTTWCDHAKAYVSMIVERLGLSRDLTIIMIAHRLSTTAYCDRVITVSAGDVCDSASPSGSSAS